MAFRNTKTARNSSIDRNTRVIFLAVFVFILFIIYFFKLFSLQILYGNEYRSQSKTISSQVNTIPA